jgi:hypothetical protein
VLLSITFFTKTNLKKDVDNIFNVKQSSKSVNLKHFINNTDYIYTKSKENFKIKRK